MGGSTKASPVITLFFYVYDTFTTYTGTRTARKFPFDLTEWVDDNGAGYALKAIMYGDESYLASEDFVSSWMTTGGGADWTTVGD